ncbi:S-adenosyl-L-methionine-dependent methyltransferase [Daldinia caldariorum]|uniref:S-adenosyl-L-methionine-dependent methyltransferase n=1 Tax=Daldinia caldariorum TaxID=326644 RepID=UPI002007BB15|nr:S-adenosyl-L-methionine-dependent methyltransferase [Daldinia caldariorum]KAI1467865.1 S-adenosyl-L-methionine-dependent methyltransferase [Daldinia caldariorum]
MKAGTTIMYANEKLGERVTKYAEAQSLQLPKPIKDYHARIIEERSDSNYMISTFQSQALIFFARAIGAKRVLEIGVYVGYSAMIWSHAIGPQGKVTGLEYSEEYAKLAQEAWKKQGYENIDVHVGPAAETLPKLADVSEPYDIIFIDADKTGYTGYLSQILEMSAPGAKNRLLRPGGIIAADNTLRHGLVADSSSDNPWQSADFDKEGSVPAANVAAIREYNDLAAANDRLETFLVPLWDGLHLSRLLD